MGELTRSAFAEVLGSSFRLHRDDDCVFEVELAELADGPLSPGRERFSLTFVGPANPACGQGMYPVEHDVMGSFVLFVVPVGQQEDGGVYYQAIFDRVSADGSAGEGR